MSITIDYKRLMYEAMQGVVRRALELCAEEGLPPQHSFYITFRTQHPGVEVASQLVAAYPDVMTIVLQHQFWDLTVDEKSFSVGLSFSSLPQVLKIPFDAVVSFADPPAEFGLRFAPPEELDEHEAAAAARGPVAVPRAGSEAKAATTEDAPPVEDEPPREAQVISIDAFRKR